MSADSRPPRDVCEVNLDALVNQIAEIGPIPQITGAPVDLMRDDSGCMALLKCFEHLREDGPTLLRGSLELFKPLADGQVVTPRIPFDGRFLLL